MKPNEFETPDKRLSALLNGLPRVTLATLPTPFEEMPNLAKALGTKHRLWIKRDDLTGLAFGGNKTRKLEFSMAAALEQGANAVITTGGIQSNHVRQTAAAAAKLGLEFHAVLTDPLCETSYSVSSQYSASGNHLLDDWFGAKLYVESNDEQSVRQRITQIQSELERRNCPSYLIPLGASDGVGAMGYVEAARELVTQWAELEILPSQLVLGTGSAGTHAGLLKGMHELGVSTEIVGVAVSETAQAKRDSVQRVLNEIGDRWGGAVTAVPKDDIVVRDDYVGEGYAIPSRASIDAIKLLARTEGILLDPVYTGKAMAGFLDTVRNAAPTDRLDLAFLHTGGAPALFAYPELVTES